MEPNLRKSWRGWGRWGVGPARQHWLWDFLLGFQVNSLGPPPIPCLHPQLLIRRVSCVSI